MGILMHFANNLKGVAVDLASLMFPPTCHVCGSLLNNSEKHICYMCIRNLPRTFCHRSDMNLMSQKFAGIIPFVRASAHFYYSRHSVVANLIQDFKYRNYPSLAIKLGQVMGHELFPTGFFSDVDMLMPIPMFFMKKARRGYNQTELIAKGISQITSIPVNCSLRATRPHATQTSLSGDERAANTIGIFSLKHPELLVGRHIMLIDDVCTTGATLRSAAQQILSTYDDPSFAPRLSLLTLCMAQS